jgi:hypothetical protein
MSREYERVSIYVIGKIGDFIKGKIITKARPIQISQETMEFCSKRNK